MREQLDLVKFGADFDALIARFSPSPDAPLALAVSGGSDSLALLSLVDAWTQSRGRELLVLTVDHHLRPEAAAEASAVAQLASSLGHTHQTLHWHKPKATQNAARDARYRLLSAAMRDHGSTALLLGHTFDDVVETAIIRRRRGVRQASIAGPTFVSPAPVWPEGRGISLLRPLIRVSRETLQAHLREREWAWIDDPSNHSDTFERVRVRKFLSRSPKLKSLSQQFVSKLQDQRELDDRALGQALAQVHVHPDGLIEIDSANASPRALALLCRCASGSAAAPRATAMVDLVARLTRPGARQTLAGAWFQKTADGFLIGRDPGLSQTTIPDSIFDGRFVRSKGTRLPAPSEQGFLVRHASPPCGDWREIISDRLTHMALCLETPNLLPVMNS